jgi:copper chaperone
MPTSSYTVTGMTCAHCVASVTEELMGIPGVSDVRIDLSTGAVSVVSETPLAPEAVAEAIDEAGYALA